MANVVVDRLELGSAGCCAELVGISSLPGTVNIVARRLGLVP